MRCFQVINLYESFTLSRKHYLLYFLDKETKLRCLRSYSWDCNTDLFVSQRKTLCSFITTQLDINQFQIFLSGDLQGEFCEGQSLMAPGTKPDILSIWSEEVGCWGIMANENKYGALKPFYCVCTWVVVEVVINMLFVNRCFQGCEEVKKLENLSS